MVRHHRSLASGSASRPRRSAPRKSSKPRGRDAETACALLTRELDDARQQQAATSEILRVISSSPADAQPVFDSIVRSAVKLCDGIIGAVLRFDGELIHSVALHNYTAKALAIAQRLYPMRPSRGQLTGRAVLTRQIIHVPDVLSDSEYMPDIALAGGWRGGLAVPMIRNETVIGVILVMRAQASPFSQEQIELLKTFADQAAIAIENVRLFKEVQARTREFSEALDQQTAISEVLQGMSSSPGELEPVFQAILAHATRLCDANYGAMWLKEGDGFRNAAFHGDLPAAYKELWRNATIGHTAPLGRVAHSRKPLQIADLREDKTYIDRHPLTVTAVEVAGIRTLVIVPMLKEDEFVGGISIYRTETRPFTDKQINLVQTFANQAVIAIDHTRLLKELRESLQQQTATADILKVISNSLEDTQPVFDAIVQSGLNLFPDATIQVSLADGDKIRLAAVASRDPARADAMRRIFPIPLTRDYMNGVAILDGRVVDIPDAENGPPELAKGCRNFLATGNRAVTIVPMMRGQTPIGALQVVRAAPGPLSDKQREVLRAFAAQAVIAIENTRLLNELRESLQQQTATADVLSVISRSLGDLAPVFQAMLSNAVRICEASYGVLFRFESGAWSAAAMHGVPPRFAEFWQRGAQRPGPRTALGRVAETKQTVHIADVTTEPAYVEGEPIFVAAVKLGRFRTILNVPMVKDDELIGTFAIYRQEVRPFTEKQIELVQNFAAQAVIAIENARLLSELRQRTDELARSVGELRALGEVTQAVNSTIDLETVLTTIVAKATQLSNTEAGAIYVFDDASREFRLRATYGMDDTIIGEIRDRHIRVGETAVGRAVEQRMPIQVSDIQSEPSAVLDVIVRAGFRALLTVPLLGADQVVGALVVRRKEPGEFAKNTVELLQTFAAQSALAIQNARLFDNVETRTRELARSLNDLRTAQDRLVQTQKLASLGQLTAGIAHEIKNPLNFVNNFSGVSVELIDELEETLGRVSADDKTRAEITELADTLRDNLDKIVQHGKRADSIVKNMLLHSREGSGERRLIDINALVEESLNLAYHGARAEKQGFNVTLQRSFDPSAGEVDAFPQEISRVLLNLISNGFYAATKRQGRESGNGFEPTITATTKSHGDCVEIRIRDNGIGIQPEVREKMFNPFFTTKPAGEGTGLGLSLSHDIIVKQHSGIIEVDTEPGAFTEFRIILPRTAT